MSDRRTMLKEISEVSFMVNDLTLYLDTHPTDPDAIKCVSEALKKRKQLMKEYADNYEPLTMDFVCPETNNRSTCFTNYPEQKHFTWTDGPLPWEGGIL